MGPIASLLVRQKKRKGSEEHGGVKEESPQGLRPYLNLVR